MPRKVKSAAAKLGSGGKKSGKKKGGKKKGGKKGKKGSKRVKSAPLPKPEINIMSPAAMENLYYIAHGPVQALEFRGFGPPVSKKKKGKGKGGKKKGGKKKGGKKKGGKGKKKKKKK